MSDVHLQIDGLGVPALWELPHNVPYLAKTRPFRDFVRRWAKPMRTCFAGIPTLVETCVFGELVPRHFKQFPSLGRFVT